MDLMVAIGDIWLTTLAWVAGLAVAFGILTRLMPCNPGMFWWKDLRAAGTDFLYWFVVPLFLLLCRLLLLIAGVLLLFGGKKPQFLPVGNLPLWLQGVAILLLQDVLLYWLHRLFHTPLVWKFHAVHHSPQVLDWTSSTRFHPLNNLLTFCLADVAVLLLGFAPEALIALAPFNLIYSAMVHANLNWTFGPLRYVFASPVFHRWHHTTEKEGLDKNFASTFPFLDLIFGTFYMPKDKLPEQFGSGDAAFPEDFVQQFLYPFRTAEHAENHGNRGRTIAVLVGVSALAVVGLSVLSVCWPRPAAPAGPGAGEEEQANLPPLRTETRPPAAFTGHKVAVLGVAISADGQRIVSGSEDGTVKVWDAAGRREGEAPAEPLLTLKGHSRHVRSVAINAAGEVIVSGGLDKTVKVWDARTGQEKHTLTGHTGGVLGVAVSADARTIVSSSADFSAKVWNAAGREQLTSPGPPGAVLSVAVSADGRTVVSASGDTAKVWDAETGRDLLTLAGHTDLVYGVAITPDGKRIVSGSLDGTVKVWDGATGQEQLTLKGHTGPVYSVAITPDGKRVVSGSDDRTVRVWDGATGQGTRALTGHTDSVTSVAISADGQRIVSGSRDGTLKVWDVPK